MASDNTTDKSCFQKHPAMTIALFTLLASLVLIFCVELVLAIINVESPPKKTSPGVKRCIRLKDLGANTFRHTVPSDEYMTKCDTLVQKQYILRTDDDGFIMPSKRHDHPDLTLVFLGGSTTECVYVNEEMRFPYLAGHVLEEKTGKKVNSYNGGVSGNNSMHSINALINKVVPLKPQIVVIEHNINDLGILLYEGTYWNDNPSKSLVQVQIPNKPEASPIICFKTLVRTAIPNIYERMWRIKNKLRRRARVDEFAHIRGKKLSMNKGKLISEFEMSLNMFISVCRARGITPVLMTQANRYRDNPDEIVLRKLDPLFSLGIGYSNYKDVYDAFNDTVRKVGRVNDVLVIDLATQVPQESKWMYDTIHLNNAGSKLVASIISKKLMSLAWIREKAGPLPQTGQTP
ncbi:MAG TPA: SGNH/GDSL hydrolase family protein [bacterium]|nr:SGNH/GDSL hydrolase family protein [bacterium]